MDNKKYGVDQIIKVLDVVIEGGNVSVKVSEATNVMSKMTAMLPITDELLRLMSLSPKLLLKQIQDVDPAEKQMLNDHFKAKFDLHDDELELKVEMGLEIVSDMLVILERSVVFAKSLKKGE